MKSLIRWCLAAVLIFATAPARSQCTWQQFHTEQPQLGFGMDTTMSMVYDSARARCVLFGGYAFGGNATSIFEWDGSLWRTHNPPNWLVVNLAPRAPGPLAYDTTRSRTVLQTNGQTWSYNGDRWIQDTLPGPSRLNAAMAYDSARDRVVLFGGVAPGSSLMGDTWEWDGNIWTRRATSGPSARQGHCMAYDNTRGRTVLFGGRAGSSGLSAQAWEWDGSTWLQTQLAPGPQARTRAQMCYDSIRRCMVLFGGNVDGIPEAVADTWELTAAGWNLRASAGPAARYGGAMAFDALRGRTVLHGGGRRSQPGVYYDTWEWDGAAWTLVAPTDPSPRSGHSLVYDQDNHRAILFGGYVGAGPPSGETWTWAGDSWTRLSTSGPPPRSSHALVYDTSRHQALLFGGNSGSAHLQDTWVLNDTGWSQRAVPGPAARSAPAMAYDELRQRVVLFGGWAGTATSRTYFDDTWEWDGQAWTQSAAHGPSARAGSAMAFDAHLGRTVLVGGTSSYLIGMADTWEWDGTTWTQGPTFGENSVDGRYDAAIAFDPVRQRTVVFGGNRQTYSTDSIWEYDGVIWTLRTYHGGFGRQAAPMIYDPVGSRFLLFGGSDGNGIHGDTLELRSDLTSPVVASQPVAQTVHNGDTVAFATTAGLGPFTYQWFQDQNIGVVDGPGGAAGYYPGGGTVSGATTATLTITSVTPSDMFHGGNFYCAISNGCTTVNTTAAHLTVIPCGTADFDHDGDFGTDADIDSFFACLAGNRCPTCGSPDFNGDGDYATDRDIEAFFRVLAGGGC